MSATRLAIQGHRLIQIGVALFLFTSFQGFAVPYFAVPNLGRSVHTLSGFTGVLLVALGLVWPRLKLTSQLSRLAFWFLIYSALATIAGFVIAALLGALGFAVVHVAALLVTEFGFWALAWGGGGANVGEIRGLVDDVLAGKDMAEHSNQTLVFGASIFALVVGLIRTIETAYTYSFFWCVASAIYLLLRMDADEKEMDEVYIEVERPKATVAPAAASAPASSPPPPASPPAAAASDGGEEGG